MKYESCFSSTRVLVINSIITSGERNFNIPLEILIYRVTVTNVLPHLSINLWDLANQSYKQRRSRIQIQWRVSYFHYVSIWFTISNSNTTCIKFMNKLACDFCIHINTFKNKKKLFTYWMFVPKFNIIDAHFIIL